MFKKGKKFHVNQASKMSYSIESVTGPSWPRGHCRLADASFRLCVILRCTCRSRRPGIYWAFHFDTEFVYFGTKNPCKRAFEKRVFCIVCDSSNWNTFTLCCAEEAVANDRENGNMIKNIWRMEFLCPPSLRKLCKQWHFTGFSPVS